MSSCRPRACRSPFQKFQVLLYTVPTQPLPWLGILRGGARPIQFLVLVLAFDLVLCFCWSCWTHTQHGVPSCEGRQLVGAVRRLSIERSSRGFSIGPPSPSIVLVAESFESKPVENRLCNMIASVGNSRKKVFPKS